MHITSPNGLPKWGTRTLCGIKGFNMDNLFPILEAARNNWKLDPAFHIPIPQSNCATCLIRQDSMFNRGWKQTEFYIQYNIYGLYWRRLEDVLTFKSWFPYRKGYKIVRVTLWDVKDIKNALELHTLGHKEF